MDFLRRMYRAFEGDLLAIPGRLIALIFGLLLIVFPTIIKEPYILRILTLTFIWALYAASWDLLVGFTGQLSLGHALLFGVAAYTTSLFNLHFHLSPWATIPIGALTSMIAGSIVCLPALRLRGFYLALVTLSLPIILTGVIFIYPDFTGGELGLFGVARLSASRTLDYYIVFFVSMVCVLVIWKFTDSKSKIVRTGIIFHAISSDEIAARAVGINTVRYKIFAFALSGFFAGISGGLYAHIMRVTGPSTLELLTSLYPVIWSIFGGLGTIYGPVAGACILYPFMETLGVVAASIRMISFAALIIAVLLMMPEGLSVWIRDKIEVRCPRCKLINIMFRQNCRACATSLHLEQEKK